MFWVLRESFIYSLQNKNIKRGIVMHKKSQAALEFLTTYAWAFLVILIMVAALAYFGILSPSKLLPDRCNFGSEVTCVDYTIGIDTLNLRLKNAVGEAIVVESITESSESVTPFACSSDPTITNWNTGETLDFSWGSCNGVAAGLVSGEKTKVSVTIKYYLAKSSADYSHEVSGEVFATVTT